MVTVNNSLGTKIKFCGANMSCQLEHPVLQRDSLSQNE